MGTIFSGPVLNQRRESRTDMSNNTLRTFIAFQLPEPAVSHLRKVQQGFQSHGFRARWVRPENIHLTLKFLGDTDPADLDRISGAMTDVAGHAAPFSLTAKGVGVFPGIKRPRVIWAGLTGQTDQVFKIQKELEQNLEKIGFPPEKRSFKAHLTIARIKGSIDSKQLFDLMETYAKWTSEPFSVDRIILYKSELKPTGAVYTELNHAGFAE